MKTVGQGIVNLTPITALIVVLASSLVLFLFASQNLESFLLAHGLPAFPLVPVSSSQAVIGALIGIGFTRGIRSINYRLLGRIASGWVTTPVIACFISFVSLFIIQNVFDQQVYRNVPYKISDNVYRKLISQGISFSSMDDFLNVEYMNALDFKNALDRTAFDLNRDEIKRVIELSETMEIQINPEIVENEISAGGLAQEEADALKRLSGKIYYYKWEFSEDLAKQSSQWNQEGDPAGTGKTNSAIRSRINYLAEKFRAGN